MKRALLVLLVAAPAAADELTTTFGGRVQADLQFRVDEKGGGDWYNRVEVPAGPDRAQSTLALKLEASYGRFKGVAHVDLVYDAFARPPGGLEDLNLIENVDPFRFEAQALYVDVKDFLFSGLDLRVGQQTILQGVGDQFNPTNNLNSDDLRDRLLFGKEAGNFMVRADYWPTEDLSFQAVLVPVFKPALLPRSAALGPIFIARTPFYDEAFRLRIEAEQAATSSRLINAPTIAESATPHLPEPTFENMQAQVRLAATLAEQDLALTYYEGRFDFPVPFANHARYDATSAGCDPDDTSRCINGLIKTNVALGYPRMSVIGVNAAGEIPLSWIKDSLHGLGYRLEGALVLPRRALMTISNDELPLPIAPQPAGEYDYDNDGLPGGPRPASVEDKPFGKWVVGLDYTFGEHVYLNGQWVHGLPDEHGAGRAVRDSGVTTEDGVTLVQCALPHDGTRCAWELTRPRIADYVVLGVDFKFANNAALIRLFNILDVSGADETHYDSATLSRVREKHGPFSAKGFSAIIYPEVNYNFGNGLDLGAGLLLQLGKDTSKFGDPAAGGSLAWARARFAF